MCLNWFLPNLMVKFALYVDLFRCQCRTKLIFVWFGKAVARRIYYGKGSEFLINGFLNAKPYYTLQCWQGCILFPMANISIYFFNQINKYRGMIKSFQNLPITLVSTSFKCESTRPQGRICKIASERFFLAHRDYNGMTFFKLKVLTCDDLTLLCIHADLLDRTLAVTINHNHTKIVLMVQLSFVVLMNLH